MKQFLFKLAVFTAIHITLLTVVYGLYTKRFPPANNYYLAGLDKHTLLKTQTVPRLIFIGGSSMAFGMDSALVAQRCGLHPVNMGLHLGIGLEFMLQEVEPYLRGGDVVVVSPEYDAFVRYYWSEPEFVARVVECRPALLRGLSSRQLKGLVDEGYVHHVGRVIRSVLGRHARLLEQDDVEGVYRRQSFNHNGDLTGHHGLPARTFLGKRFLYEVTPASEAAIEHLNRFHANCRRMGVRVLFSHPPYEQRTFRLSRQAIDQIEISLRARMTIPMLDAPEEMSFPHDDFFDTEYHLALAGKTKRSEMIAERLLRALNDANSVAPTPKQ